MRILVTGSAGHLGEALVRCLQASGHQVMGLDILPSPYTHIVGSITDRSLVRRCMSDIEVVLHTATLHKPHVVTHSKQSFVDTNISGTLNLLEEAIVAGVKAFIFTSTTSAFGRALNPAPDQPAAWITEEVIPVPKNIYGVSKTAAENLCELFANKQRLPCLVLRTSRFFPEADDNPKVRAEFEDSNAKANELLYRRADIQDIVSAHVCAMDKLLSAPPNKPVAFARYIISATTPFAPKDLPALQHDASAVLASYFPDFPALYTKRKWTMFNRIDRVYVNARARIELGWQPQYDFAHVLTCLHQGTDHRSPLALTIGSKGYHTQAFGNGPYPVN
jgi:UDP-glucose 4-epimerase